LSLLKVKRLAHDIYEQYFRAAQAVPRGVVATLCAVVARLNAACEKHNTQSRDVNRSTILKSSSSVTSLPWIKDMSEALDQLLSLLIDEHTVSAYELHSSGLVQALLNILNTSDVDRTNIPMGRRLSVDRIGVFRESFRDRETGSTSPATALVRKLVSVLESIEKLPVYAYDAPGSGYGLQILTRRLRFRLERAPGETVLIDRTGRNLKMEPLATVASLSRYLLKMVAKQWYDFDRSTFTFLARLSEPSFKGLTFTHQRDFDENGVFYWIGTNAKTVPEWVNPAQYGLVVVTSSEGRKLPYGKLEEIISRDVSAHNCHTNDDKKAWFAVDLGLWLIPSCYTLRHARGYGRSALRNWQLQVINRLIIDKILLGVKKYVVRFGYVMYTCISNNYVIMALMRVM